MRTRGRLVLGKDGSALWSLPCSAARTASDPWRIRLSSWFIEPRKTLRSFTYANVQRLVLGKYGRAAFGSPAPLAFGGPKPLSRQNGLSSASAFAEAVLGSTTQGKHYSHSHMQMCGVSSLESMAARCEPPGARWRLRWWQGTRTYGR